MVGSMWSDRRIALVVSTAVAIIGGIVAAWLMPRGPVTTTEALVWMAGTLITGLLGGLVLGSRWSMLLSPVAFVVAFELARMGTQGPTVDGVYLGSTYGVIAFVVGRGVTYLLGLAPMVLGCLYGVELAARAGRERSSTLGAIGWGLTLIASVAIIGLAVLVARPASTSPVLGADGQPVPGSITELTSVPSAVTTRP